MEIERKKERPLRKAKPLKTKRNLVVKKLQQKIALDFLYNYQIISLGLLDLIA